jgi:hypothetical protein
LPIRVAVLSASLLFLRPYHNPICVGAPVFALKSFSADAMAYEEERRSMLGKVERETIWMGLYPAFSLPSCERMQIAQRRHTRLD